MDLQELGLTANESKVYETLLKYGALTAANCAKQSQVPYGRIYTVLDSLERKGLIKILPEQTKKFVPSDPQELDELITKKKDSLDALKQKIKAYKTLYHERKPEAIQISYDRHNFHKLVAQMKKAEHYSYSIKYAFATDPAFMRDVKELTAQKVDYRALGRIDKETAPSVKKWHTITTHIRHIPNEGVAVSIIDDEEMLISCITTNTMMLIKDKPLIKLMKELFLRYYETQPEITQDTTMHKKRP